MNFGEYSYNYRRMKQQFKMTAEELGSVIGEQFKESKSRTETQGLEAGSISSYFTFGNYQFRVTVTKVLIEQQNIGGDSGIWGNAEFGIWGTAKWGSTAQQSFILGSFGGAGGGLTGDFSLGG